MSASGSDIASRVLDARGGGKPPGGLAVPVSERLWLSTRQGKVSDEEEPGQERGEERGRVGFVSWEFRLAYENSEEGHSLDIDHADRPEVDPEEEAQLQAMTSTSETWMAPFRDIEQHVLDHFRRDGNMKR